jgi:hypothetical protein
MTTHVPETTTGRLSRAAVAGLLGLTAATIAAADLLNPQYSPLSEVVSRYVNGTAGWLVTLAILSMGAASAVLLGLLRGRGTGWRAGRWALAVWTAGVLVAGLFPADPPGRWSNPSTSDMLHGTAAWLAFLAFPVAALTLSGKLGAARAALRGLAVASALATAALVVCMADVMSGPSLGVGGAPTLLGLVERLLIAVDLIWLGLAGLAATSRCGKIAGCCDSPISSSTARRR